MAGFLEQLENNEVLLLMYLADELPPEDKLEVEQKLATDAGLRDSLADLRLSHAAYIGAMQALDAVARPPTSETVARRRVARVIRQWTTDRLARPAAPPPKGLLYPWWCYPFAAAAAVLIGFLVWWGNNSESGRVPPSSPAWHTDVARVQPPVPSPALASLTDDQRNALLEAFAPGIDSTATATGTTRPSPADVVIASTALDDAEVAVAGLRSGDDADAVFFAGVGGGGPQDDRQVNP